MDSDNSRKQSLCILKGYLAFLLKKHSSLTHPISSQLNRFIETGIYSRIYEKHLSKMKKARRSYKKGILIKNF
ncbi:hypothetical protein Avbf_09865 [Armadillidium vulgare]|nr:hypothetical protein Avbf_09865 [Armadillidium vulgare]